MNVILESIRIDRAIESLRTTRPSPSTRLRRRGCCSPGRVRQRDTTARAHDDGSHAAMVKRPSRASPARFSAITPLVAANDGAQQYERHVRLPALPDWVVVGGESGPEARPMDPRWVESLQRQCADEGVPFFFKQWGGPARGKGGCILAGAEVKAWPPAVAA